MSPCLLSEVDVTDEQRFSLNSPELDRLLGGGIVKGSITLLGGEPGIGKSTLALQIPLYCQGLKTLYVSGEESVSQVKLRAGRLGGDGNSCYIYSETLVENILSQASRLEPDLLIVDSIQTVYSDNVESSPGTVGQVRECAAKFLRYAKENGVPVLLIGHITKDGSIAADGSPESLYNRPNNAFTASFTGDGTLLDASLFFQNQSGLIFFRPESVIISDEALNPEMYPSYLVINNVQITGVEYTGSHYLLCVDYNGSYILALSLVKPSKSVISLLINEESITKI